MSRNDKSLDLLKNLIDTLKNNSPTSNSSRKLVNQKEMNEKIDKKINQKINDMMTVINQNQPKPKITDVQS